MGKIKLHVEDRAHLFVLRATSTRSAPRCGGRKGGGRRGTLYSGNAVCWFHQRKVGIAPPKEDVTKVELTNHPEAIAEGLGNEWSQLS